MPSRGGLFVDCTVGLGGHTRALLEAGASRRARPRSRHDGARARRRRAGGLSATASSSCTPTTGSSARSSTRAACDRVDGVLADLGVSSMQLDTEGRGFSFRRDEPLDMRMDQTQGQTAADLLAAVDEEELANVIFQYGEERYSRRIARRIVEARQAAPIATTGQLARIVRRAVPHKGYQRIDPATRTFQALRIWVNRELEGLDGVPAGGVAPAARRGAARGHHVPLARGSHRQAHVPGAGRRRSGAAGADAQAGDARRRRSGAQPAGAQREAARD